MESNPILPSQRRHFELPEGVSYLDAAAWSPLPHAARAAGEAGIRAKSQPWSHSRTAFPPQTERARALAAALIGASPNDIAIVGAVSHAMSIVAHQLALSPGGRILRVADEFPSLCLPFDRLAARCGLIVEVVERPADGDWTQALLAAIARPGAPPLSLATLTPLHWMDGTLIDLDRIAPAVHASGAILVIDATQAVGAIPVDVTSWRPDYLAFPTYKWTLGPYGLAFLYAAPHRQDGLPLDEHNGNRPPAVGARRYDRGELHDPVALPMAAEGLSLVAEWGAPVISQRLKVLTDRLAHGCTALGLEVAPPSLRVPHVLGVKHPDGLPEGIVAKLAERKVFASERGGGLRFSPHVWAEEGDIDSCLAALADLSPVIPR